MADSQNLLRIFERVRHLPRDERIVEYDAVALSDADRIRVESWIANWDAAKSAADDAGPIEDGAGVRIGRYKLLQPIGEGGFGVVWMADQQTPVERRVAVKIIKPGMDSRAVIARFEAERQALAMMDHSNIAAVLDAGTTESGRPFFVMELVKGDPITDYADRNHLSIPERLRLFRQVCDAVQHAHQKGIIHRDIKPTNVLVETQDGRPLAKVIDFGIAKALAGRLTDKTLFTDFKQFIGTPQYMSPEQADGSADIDTRSDVYSLGILLYELLAGYKPFDEKMLKEAAYDEIRRIIREVDPPKPSTRLSSMGTAATTIATARRQQLPSLTRELRSELEWIPMMAMRKDRNRRYSSPLQMAEDVLNYLNDRPLLAGPESWIYQIRKTARRNRGLVLAAAAFVLLTGISIVSLARANTAQRDYDALRFRTLQEKAEAAKKAAQRERETARQQGKEIGAESAFFELLVSASSPFGPQIANADHDPRVSQVLAQAASRVEKDFDNHPAEYAGIAGSIAGSYIGLGKYSAAVPFAQKSFDAYYAIDPTTSSAAIAYCRYIAALAEHGDWTGLRKLFDRAGGLQWAKTILGPTDFWITTAERFTARMLEEEGDNAGAEKLYQKTLADLSSNPGENAWTILRVRDFLAHFYAQQGQLAKSIAMYRQIVDQARGVPEEKNGMLSAWISLLGQCLFKEGTHSDLVEAEKLLRESLGMRQADLPSTHIEINSSLVPLARLLDWEHRNGEAKPYWEMAVDIARTQAVDEERRWWTFARYVESLRRQGFDAEADSVLEKEIEDLTKSGADANLRDKVRAYWKDTWVKDAETDAARPPWK